MAYPKSATPAVTRNACLRAFATGAGLGLLSAVLAEIYLHRGIEVLLIIIAVVATERIIRGRLTPDASTTTTAGAPSSPQRDRYGNARLVLDRLGMKRTKRRLSGMKILGFFGVPAPPLFVAPRKTGILIGLFTVAAVAVFIRLQGDFGYGFADPRFMRMSLLTVACASAVGAIAAWYCATQRRRHSLPLWEDLQDH